VYPELISSPVVLLAFKEEEAAAALLRAVALETEWRRDPLSGSGDDGSVGTYPLIVSLLLNAVLNTAS
jgi:hypothetical protein